MLSRTSTAALLLGVVLALSHVPALRADDLCKPGHVLDASRQLCYDPAAAYRPNVPAQQSLFGGSAANDASKSSPSAAPESSSGGGFFGWLSDQMRFCRYGDRQVGSGDAAYCVGQDGKSYPAGKY